MAPMPRFWPETDATQGCGTCRHRGRGETMLSQADRVICERDPDVPGLAVLLDAADLGRKTGLGRLTTHYLRYKPRGGSVHGCWLCHGHVCLYARKIRRGAYPSEMARGSGRGVLRRHVYRDD